MLQHVLIFPTKSDGPYLRKIVWNNIDILLLPLFGMVCLITLLELPDQFRNSATPIWIKWLVGWLDFAFVSLWVMSLQSQRLNGYNENHWKQSQLFPCVNDYFCSRSQRHADFSTNHRLLSVCSPVQQRLCACVWLQWGKLPEWVLPATGCLQTAERNTCGVRGIMCHRYVWGPEDSLRLTEGTGNPKTTFCFSCHLQINYQSICIY